MNTQPEALRLADILQYKLPSVNCLENAAAELRLLHEVNQELLEALIRFEKEYVRLVESGDAGNWEVDQEEKVIQARAAIKKAANK